MCIKGQEQALSAHRNAMAHITLAWPMADFTEFESRGYPPPASSPAEGSVGTWGCGEVVMAG